MNIFKKTLNVRPHTSPPPLSNSKLHILRIMQF